MNFTTMRSLIIANLLLVPTCFLGCGDTYKADYSKLGLVPVAGTIKLDGEPLADAVVFFVHADETKSFATTDLSGNYRMKFNSEIDGVLPGDVTVEVSTTASTGEINLAGGESEEDPDAPKAKTEGKVERVPAPYNKKSRLKVTVSASTKQFDFDLKSDGSTTGPN